MNIKKLIILSVFLGVINAYAQDTVSHSQRVREQISPITNLLTEAYSSPSLYPFSRKFNYSLLAANLENTKKDLYLRQEGSGNGAFKINSESFLKNISGISLWGKAYYTNEKIKKVNFNETLDYQYVYPYVMADTVGGDLNAETYYFGGGLSKKIGELRYGIQGSFKGIQAYRDRDPRPKNISSDIDFSVSVAKELNKGKALSLDFNLRKYNQNNSLQFVNELGFPLVYHDAGLGVFNELLAGTRMQAYYKGLSLGTQLNFAPIDLKGLSVQIGFNRFNIDKELSSIATNIAEIKENHAYLLLAYHRQLQSHNFLVRIKGAYVKREGVEAIYANTGAASLLKVSEEVRYNREKLNVKLDVSYGKATKNLSWFLGIDGTFGTDNESYILPDRFIEYQTGSVGAFASLTKTVGKTMLNLEMKASQIKVLNSDYSWENIDVKKGIYQMLNANYAYLTSDVFSMSSSLRADFPFNAKLGAFAKIKGMRTNYAGNNKGSELLLSFGVLF
ncbi:DUF6850 family outer membrane beta-barrel protein [Pedobacter sp.]|uniref:DUF6850 family outer membrane beta-barrel protein n=1 Tax=Pedobacter sp. TaxID=1411316 RepID=UPI0031DE7B94